MKEIKEFKKWTKNKVKFTQALLVAFLITGGISFAETVINTTEITINKIEEATGLQLGTDARARGIGSIATGKNAIAIGKNAVATGGNESKQTIEAKLLENSTKLAEIANKQREIDSMTRDLEALKVKEHETIQAGIRVRELAKAKENAKLEWVKLQGEHKAFVDSNASFFAENKAKIDDLNSRLAGVSQLTNVDISSEQGLTKAAHQLKAIAEKGTALNLTEGFYKDYVGNYYRALGDLRQNNIRFIKMNDNAYSKKDSYGRDYSNGNQNVVSPYINFGVLDAVIREGFYYTGANLTFSTSADYVFIWESSSKNLKKIETKDIDTDITTLEEFNMVKEELPKYKEAFHTYMQANNDQFLTQDIKDKMYSMVDIKIERTNLVYEITYYQGEYEKTKNTTWMDKKKEALNRLNLLNEKWGSLKKEGTPIELRKANIEKWRKENITDVEEKNKVTTETLTKELEEALGINKDAILEREKEIEAKRKAAENAENTYRNMNPNEKDLILAREYERVALELKTKGEALKTATERLEALKGALSLHDLKNKGEDAIAFGTDNLASGNASVALGKANVATKENAIALGSTNLASGDNAIAIGHGNNALSANSIALGQQNSVNGEKSIAIGYGHKIVGKGSATLGDPNTIYGDNNFALGNNNTIGTETALKNNVFILGSNVDASTVENAIVLGNTSSAISNSVSVGSVGAERQIKFVKDATENQDAVTLKQLKEFVSKFIPTSSKEDIPATLYDSGIAKTITLGNVLENKYSLPTTKIMVNDVNFLTKEEATAVINSIKEANPEKAELESLTTSNFDKYGNLVIDNKNIFNLHDLVSKKTGSESISPGNGDLVFETGNTLSTTIEKELVMKAPGGTTVRNLKAGRISKDSKEAINGGQFFTLQETVDTKADKTTVYTKTEVDNLISRKVTTTELNTTLDNYLKKDASNLDKVSKTAITSKLNEGANISTPTGTLVTDTNVKEHLEANYTNNTALTTKLDTLKTEINNTTDSKITENNKNYYTKTEVDKKLTDVTVKTEADVTSSTLDITNGANRLIGTENLVIDIKDNAITESKISKELKTKIEDKYTKEEANTKFVDKTSLNTSLDKKANINGDNIVTKKEKEDFRNNIEVYSKTEVETKLKNIKAGTADLSGDITETEEKGVKGKVIHKHLKNNYINKEELQVRDGAIINNYQEIQANKAAIANNTKRIEQVDKKVNKTAALAQATANLDFGNVRVGNMAIGAGVGNYMSETGVSVGVAYRPTEDIFLTAKWSGLAGEPRYNSYGASASYQFNFK